VKYSFRSVSSERDFYKEESQNILIEEVLPGDQSCIDENHGKTVINIVSTMELPDGQYTQCRKEAGRIRVHFPV
jgi:hypothetical protein